MRMLRAKYGSQILMFSFNFLNASKAIDKVLHYELFEKLLDFYPTLFFTLLHSDFLLLCK